MLRGAKERSDWTGWLRALKYDAKKDCWVGRTKKGVELRVRFLRPKKALPKPAPKKATPAP